eukprot:snap_masked-scaffold_48-processed-gene-1.63-mRNA-1 protein AED:1.00 eAED:1.00 QI:0/-1/0/0/-1/1/1/0/998
MSLTPSEHQRLKASLPLQFDLITYSIARLFLSSPDPKLAGFADPDSILAQFPALTSSRWTDTEVTGAICLVKDFSDPNQPTFFQIYSLKTFSLLFEYELYEDINYVQDREENQFHYFEMEDCVAGFAFSSLSDANAFFAHVLTNKPRAITAAAQAANKKKRLTRKKKKREKKGNGIFGMFKKKDKNELNLDDIGTVGKVEHVGHVGLGAGGLEASGLSGLEGMNPEWKRLFKEAGIRKKDLRGMDINTARDFLDMVQQQEYNGGRGSFASADYFSGGAAIASPGSAYGGHSMYSPRPSQVQSHYTMQQSQRGQFQGMGGAMQSARTVQQGRPTNYTKQNSFYNRGSTAVQKLNGSFSSPNPVQTFGTRRYHDPQPQESVYGSQYRQSEMEPVGGPPPVPPRVPPRRAQPRDRLSEELRQSLGYQPSRTFQSREDGYDRVDDFAQMEHYHGSGMMSRKTRKSRGSSAAEKRSVESQVALKKEVEKQREEARLAREKFETQRRRAEAEQVRLNQERLAREEEMQQQRMQQERQRREMDALEGVIENERGKLAELEFKLSKELEEKSNNTALLEHLKREKAEKERNLELRLAEQKSKEQEMAQEADRLKALLRQQEEQQREQLKQQEAVNEEAKRLRKQLQLEEEERIRQIKLQEENASKRLAEVIAGEREKLDKLEVRLNQELHERNNDRGLLERLQKEKEDRERMLEERIREQEEKEKMIQRLEEEKNQQRLEREQQEKEMERMKEESAQRLRQLQFEQQQLQKKLEEEEEMKKQRIKELEAKNLEKEEQDKKLRELEESMERARQEAAQAKALAKQIEEEQRKKLIETERLLQEAEERAKALPPPPPKLPLMLPPPPLAAGTKGMKPALPKSLPGLKGPKAPKAPPLPPMPSKGEVKEEKNKDLLLDIAKGVKLTKIKNTSPKGRKKTGEKKILPKRVVRRNGDMKDHMRALSVRLEKVSIKNPRQQNELMSKLKNFIDERRALVTNQDDDSDSDWSI